MGDARSASVVTLLASGSIANNAVGTGSEVDVLGDNASEGYIDVYLDITSTVAAGTVDVRLWPSSVTGSAYPDDAPVVASFVPKNGTKHCFCGSFLTQRFMTGSATNNATGAAATCALSFILLKRS